MDTSFKFQLKEDAYILENLKCIKCKVIRREMRFTEGYDSTGMYFAGYVESYRVQFIDNGHNLIIMDSVEPRDMFKSKDELIQHLIENL
jgi:hypothetical protein